VGRNNSLLQRLLVKLATGTGQVANEEESQPYPEPVVQESR